MKLNEKLKVLRESKDYSQDFLANYLGIGQTTYSRYESLKTYLKTYLINFIYIKVYKKSLFQGL